MKLVHTALIAALLLALALPAPLRAAEGESPAGADYATALQTYYQQQWNEAGAAFQQIVEKDPRDTMALVYLIHTYIKRNDLRSILYQIEQKVVATDNKDATALAHLGIGYLARSMREPQLLDEAQKSFEKSLVLDKDLSIAHCGLGLVYYQRRMMARAKGHFLEAVRANPNDLMAIERLGDITMVDEKRPSEAVSMFENLIVKAPTYPDGYWYVGSAQFDMARYDRCVENMQKCMELDPQGVTQGYHAPMLMGKAYLKLKDYEKAKDAFERALQLNPNNPEARHYLSEAENPPKNK